MEYTVKGIAKEELGKRRWTGRHIATHGMAGNIRQAPDIRRFGLVRQRLDRFAVPGNEAGRLWRFRHSGPPANGKPWEDSCSKVLGDNYDTKLKP